MMRMKSYLLLPLIFLLIIYSSKSAGFLMKCKKNERAALITIKNSFSKDPMNRLSSWVGDDCCHQWVGVKCDNVTGNVIKLNLQQKLSYNDSCYSQGSMVSSGLSPALLELKFLRYLSLAGNDFNGSQIPEFIGSMRHLRHLDLSRGGFAGLVPPQLGNLTYLKFLDLHVPFQCLGIGGLYAQSLGWASGLSKLRFLDMGSCIMSEAHDTFQVLVRLPSLSLISLAACQLPKTHLSEALLNYTSTSYFQHLQHLDLSYNNLDGPLPSMFKHMVSLRRLILSYNGFNGSIPLWLRNMTDLQVLKMRSNNISLVEGGLWEIMGNPCNFKYLDLSDNAIVQGGILDPSLNSSTCPSYDIEYLNLLDNKLDGSLPSLLGKLTNLQYLDLSNNGFQGEIPASLGKLLALEYLDLSVNRLSGLIPDFVQHLAKIEYLDLSSNSMTGTLSGIGNLSKLSFLDASFNHISLNLTFNRPPSFTLEVFRAHSCKINTVFPPWLMNQTRIEQLDLSYTGIYGELPGWLWNISRFQTLQVSGNQLTGSLPQHIVCDGCNLWLLDLHNNSLTGSIPHWLSHLETINVIILSANKLSGAVFEGENASSLLTGKNVLNVLDLDDNMLFGEIQVGDVFPDASLKILSLRGNNFTGPIRSQLCQFRSLRILELAQNHLTGQIPHCLGSIQFDSDAGGLISRTGVEIAEIIKGIMEMVAGTRGTHSLIDLSSNHLVGTIPEELTNISTLEGLNLSNNHLTGGIPAQIGNLMMLESLDLSNNQLSSIIPQSLSAIPWIVSLNLSNNNLHGPVPTGSQLQTLIDPSIYAGNPGLCGSPLPNKCTNVPPSTTEDEDEDEKHEHMWFYAIIMLGVGTGFWVVVGTLVIKKSWRVAYFRFVEETAVKIHEQFKSAMNGIRRRL
ncbi:receptor-like protein EIX2 [Silene latifolia]|uniref:receptor-like protein EIX2 n=1 Tax=Silene latifolia TaxID=37657 RepID=UPI003D785460